MRALFSFLVFLVGAFAFFTLPALWLAWEPDFLLAVLAAGVVAAVVYVLLYPLSNMAKPPGHA